MYLWVELVHPQSQPSHLIGGEGCSLLPSPPEERDAVRTSDTDGTGTLLLHRSSQT